MDNYIAPGDLVTVAAPAVVTAGQIVVIGTNLLGVAQNDAVTNGALVIATRGIFTLPADVTTATAAVGQYATHHTTNNTVSVTTPGAGFVKMGVFTKAKVNGDTTVQVRLNGAF